MNNPKNAAEEFTAQDILDYLDANLHHLHKYKDGRIIGKFGGVTAIGDGSVSEFIKTTMQLIGECNEY